MHFLKWEKMCDFVGMPNKITCVDGTVDVEWLILCFVFLAFMGGSEGKATWNMR